MVDVETSGIRIKSGVDVNNPRVYGFEALRITDRSTEMLDIMKEDRGFDQGLAGGLLSKPKAALKGGIQKIKSKLGFPLPSNPSNVIKMNKGGSLLPPELLHFDRPFKGNENQTAMVMAKTAGDAGGTEIGKLLAQSFKADPKTIGPQLLGGAVDLLKDKARDFLFGSGDLNVNNVPGQSLISGFGSRTQSDVYPIGNFKYSETLKKIQKGKGVSADDETSALLKELDMRRVSPIFGVVRKETMPGKPKSLQNQFGYSEYSYNYLEKQGESLPKYTPEQDAEGNTKNSYTTDDNRKKVIDSRKDEGAFAGKSLDERGVGRKEKNIIGLQSPQDDIKIDENNVITKDGSEYKDLVPFHITRIGFKKNIFKSYITGLSETVSPSWSSNNFIGNPYKYYIYESIERSVTFTLNIVEIEELQEIGKNYLI